MPHHMSVSKQPSQISSQTPFSEVTHRPDFPTQAGIQENPHTVHALILSNVRQIQGRSSVLRTCQSTAQKISATDTSRVKTTLTEPTWNKDCSFATVLSDKNNPSSSELLICWTCWAQELLNQLEKIHASLPWVLPGSFYGFEYHTD